MVCLLFMGPEVKARWSGQNLCKIIQHHLHILRSLPTPRYLHEGNQLLNVVDCGGCPINHVSM